MRNYASVDNNRSFSCPVRVLFDQNPNFGLRRWNQQLSFLREQSAGIAHRTDLYCPRNRCARDRILYRCKGSHFRAVPAAAAASQAVVLRTAPQRDFTSFSVSRPTTFVDPRSWEADLENLLTAEGVELGVRAKVSSVAHVFQQHEQPYWRTLRTTLNLTPELMRRYFFCRGEFTASVLLLCLMSWPREESPLRIWLVD